jgi:hypothetical protein
MWGPHTLPISLCTNEPLLSFDGPKGTQPATRALLLPKGMEMEVGMYPHSDMDESERHGTLDECENWSAEPI